MAFDTDEELRVHPSPLKKKTNTPPRYPVPADRYGDLVSWRLGRTRGSRT